jgi:hypothetical protein
VMTVFTGADPSRRNANSARAVTAICLPSRGMCVSHRELMLSGAMGGLPATPWDGGVEVAVRVVDCR